ncbi:MAG: glutamyl-tRNA reductase [Candidatus Desulfofervidaceae bacterium]|nr:glutamyl-tRNA reductase [Candidatus Desulfofervidaceae bacterium]
MDTTIVLIGVNHKTAPVEIREKLGASKNAEEILLHLTQFSPLKEILFLSTCNRVEILFTSRMPKSGIEMVKKFLAEFNQVPLSQFESSLYIYQQAEAVQHLFRVASSLDSMVVGEPQILGQIKDAYRLALKHRTAGPILNRLLHKAFSVAKRIRTETKLAHHAVSVSYAAVEMAKKIFGHLEDKKILLIGAGEMAELAVQHLLNNGVESITVANRTLERAIELAERFKGKPISFEERIEALGTVDIVISSTGASHFVIHYEDVKQVMRKRRHKPIFFIDIAVPRDIDPEINQLDNAYVYDIDDLQSVVELNRAKREKEARKAERIVEEETIKFQRWLETLDVVPTIIALKHKLEEIRHKELNKTFSHLKHLSEEDKKAIYIMTEAMIKKILHDPIKFLKQKEDREKIEVYLDITRRLFNLDASEEMQDRGYHSKK